MNKLFYPLALFLSLTLSGCDNSTPSNTNSQANTQAQTSSATTNAPTPQKTAEQSEYISPLPDSAPSINVAVTGVDEPFTFKDNFGNLQGIEIDIIRAIGVAEGFKVNFQEVARENLLTAIENGDHPMTIAVLGDTEERRKRFILSDPYFSSPSVFIYTDPNLTITQGYQDLIGKKVGVIKDSYHSKELAEKGPQSELIYVDTPFLLLSGLLRGDFDAGAQDKTLIQYMITQYPEAQGKVKIAPYSVDDNSDVVMAINKNETELAKQINDGIAAIKASGELDKINQKWLGE